MTLKELLLPAEVHCRASLLEAEDRSTRSGHGLTVLGPQGLAAFLKAIGYLIPLMDAEYANYYTREVMLILIREFQSPDEEMKKIVLKVGGVYRTTCFDHTLMLNRT